MNIKKTSGFKAPEQDKKAFQQWINLLSETNNREYPAKEIQTSLGKTVVYCPGIHSATRENLILFPGARTTSLIWDFDRGLDHLGDDVNIFLVETNGLPNLSDGKTPDIKSNDFGIWAGEVFEQLGIESGYIAGASFGGLICMKLGIVHPEKVKAAFLLAPGCLQPFSLKFRNLYLNLLPLLAPSRKNIVKFLDNAVFYPPHHDLSAPARELLIQYQELAIKRYRDKTQKPYYMKEELAKAEINTYVLLGDKDPLFPAERSRKNAVEKLKHLKEVRVIEKVGHGMECYPDALKSIREKIEELES